MVHFVGLSPCRFSSPMLFLQKPPSLQGAPCFLEEKDGPLSSMDMAGTARVQVACFLSTCRFDFRSAIKVRLIWVFLIAEFGTGAAFGRRSNQRKALVITLWLPPDVPLGFSWAELTLRRSTASTSRCCQTKAARGGGRTRHVRGKWCVAWLLKKYPLRLIWNTQNLRKEVSIQLRKVFKKGTK